MPTRLFMAVPRRGCASWLCLVVAVPRGCASWWLALTGARSTSAPAVWDFVQLVLDIFTGFRSTLWPSIDCESMMDHTKKLQKEVKLLPRPCVHGIPTHAPLSRVR